MSRISKSIPSIPSIPSVLLAVAIVSVVGCHKQSRELYAPVVRADSVSDGYGARPTEQASGVPSFEPGKTDKVARVEEMLIGRFPGVNVQRAGNGMYSVTMRGVGSFLSSEQALFVIDGVPYEGSLAWLNPADVTRIDLLRNPVETSIYGVRGSNGVILITTRKKR